MTEGAAPPGATRRVVKVEIESTGREVQVDVPVDVTDAELLEFASWLTAPGGLRELLSPQSPIVLLHPRVQ